MHREGTPDLTHALAHARESHTERRFACATSGGSCRKTAAGILDFELDTPRDLRESHRCPRACGMTVHVRERFLGDAEQCQFLIRAQPPQCLGELELNLDRAALAQAVSEPP